MSKRAFGAVGHGGSDPGALGNGLKEADINLDIALSWESEMKRHGVETKLSRYKNENDDLNEEVRECNTFDPDVAVAFHTNAGGGDGFEIFCSISGGLGKVLAQNINSEVVAIGQNTRGVKTRKNSSGKDYYGFIRNTKCPAVIAECAFIDNSKDVTIVDTKEERIAFGIAVAKGTLKALGIEYKPAGSTTYTVKINTDVLNVRSGPSTDYPVTTQVTRGEVFTIVEESNGWGKLKSGAGWIKLSYTIRN